MEPHRHRGFQVHPGYLGLLERPDTPVCPGRPGSRAATGLDRLDRGVLGFGGRIWAQVLLVLDLVGKELAAHATLSVRVCSYVGTDKQHGREGVEPSRASGVGSAVETSADFSKC